MAYPAPKARMPSPKDLINRLLGNAKTSQTRTRGQTVTRIHAFGALEHAVPFLPLHGSQGGGPASHGSPAPDALDEVKPAQGQDVPVGQPGGIGSLGRFSSNNGSAYSRLCRLDRLCLAPEKNPGTNRLKLKAITPWCQRQTLCLGSVGQGKPKPG